VSEHRQEHGLKRSARAARQLNRHPRLVAPARRARERVAIVERKGEVVKRLGDGLMAVFRDASNATGTAFDAREHAASIEVEGAATVTATKRRFSAMGVPKDLTAHVVDRAESATSTPRGHQTHTGRTSGSRQPNAALR